MKRSLFILALALVAGAVAFILTRSRCGCEVAQVPAGNSSHARLPALDWLRHEFQLSDEQFTQFSALHLAYQPTCEELCQKILTSQRKVMALTAEGSSVTPALKAALLENATLRAECQAAMVGHLYQSAACMSADRARHYLREMLPQALEMPMDLDTPHSRH